ncbi:hypothetical protein [Vibrio crassostreae]|uniref:hypothetical protein n=1 Tax=Vibrio crassostreae TaxID=246167 RepID=UPI001B309AEB|nr:hypothetical protein [Vibrio crassostreae]
MIQELRASLHQASTDVDKLIPESVVYEGESLKWRIHQHLIQMSKTIEKIELKGVSLGSRQYISECNQKLNTIDSLLETYRD